MVGRCQGSIVVLFKFGVSGVAGDLVIELVPWDLVISVHVYQLAPSLLCILAWNRTGTWQEHDSIISPPPP